MKKFCDKEGFGFDSAGYVESDVRVIERKTEKSKADKYKLINQRG